MTSRIDDSFERNDSPNWVGLPVTGMKTQFEGRFVMIEGISRGVWRSE